MEFDITKNLEEFDLVFLDLETTGLDVIMGDAICEIGAYKVRNRKIIDTFHSLVNPEKAIPLEAQRVHRISDEEVKFAPPFRKIAPKLMSFSNGSVLCAYNVSFDMGFIDYHLKAAGCLPLAQPALDILAMARDALTLSRYTLANVAQSLELSNGITAHRALEDALVSYRVFFKLIDIFKEKKIETLAHFLCLYGFANTVVKSQDHQKLELINQALATEQSLELTYFSDQARIEKETIMPLRILQESNCFYLLYQANQETSRRIRSNRILAIKALP